MRSLNDPLPPAKTILALDLGKFKSVACVLDVAANAHRFQTIITSPSAVHDLLVEVMPDRLVIEACSISGWVCDLERLCGFGAKAVPEWDAGSPGADHRPGARIAPACAGSGGMGDAA
jgi:hypothetical protein